MSSRILFASFGAYGHVFPLVPLAIAARDLGHRVAFATAVEFHPALTAAGLDVLVAGCTVDEAVQAAMAGVATERVAAYGEACGRILPGRMIAERRPLLAAGDIALVVHGLGTPGAGDAGRMV